jgi:hypothetical protein
MAVLLVIFLALVFAGAGGYFGYGRWGSTGGAVTGLVIVSLILLLFYLLRALRTF